MKILRLALIASILLMAYTVAVIALMWPWAGVVMGILAAISLGRKGVQYTAHGTARWADITDIPHMLEGAGLILGYIAGKAKQMAGGENPVQPKTPGPDRLPAVPVRLPERNRPSS